MSNLKTCKKCGNEKNCELFPSRVVKGKIYYRRECKECYSETRKHSDKKYRDNNKDSIRNYKKKYRQENKLKISSYQSKYYSDNIEKFKHSNYKYKQENKDSIREYMIEYRKDNSDRLRKYMRDYHYEYRMINPDKINAKTAKRRAMKLQATPEWLTEDQHSEIESLYSHARDCYLVTGEPYHVDHIVPLKGKNVRGLHVPWNLQVLPADVNLRKHNK